MLVNDPDHSQLALTVSGYVEKFVTISPRRLRLVSSVGQRIERAVMIIPEKKYPFKILDAKARRGKDIHFKLEETNKAEGISYILKVENLKKEKGYYFDMIELKTDSKIQPRIFVRVDGNIIEKRPKNKKTK